MDRGFLVKGAQIRVATGVGVSARTLIIIKYWNICSLLIKTVLLWRHRLS